MKIRRKSPKIHIEMFSIIITSFITWNKPADLNTLYANTYIQKNNIFYTRNCDEESFGL